MISNSFGCKMDLDADAFILCAGKQTRYHGSGSKLMFDVNGRPAFYYTMKTISGVFSEERISIITSNSFLDFNEFVTSFYPKANLIFDDNPGDGTACSFRKALFMWQMEAAFISAGDIFYTPELILELAAEFFASRANACIAVTPDISIAPSHRQISLNPFLIADSANSWSGAEYRNIGAYFLRSSVKEYFNYDNAKGLIDVIRHMQEAGELVLPFVYKKELLHTTDIDDVNNWRYHFNQQYT